MSRFARATVTAAVATLMLLAACSGGPGASTSAIASASQEGSNPCDRDNLTTVTDGRLTIGTDNPAYPPYWDPPAEGETATDPWEFGDPYNKRGFEGAVAWAVAEQLGFGDADVDFVAVPFDNSFAPGEKDFDFYLAQVSYRSDRAAQVDMSDGYYLVNQALVANAGTPITNATSIADLADFRLGAQATTTSLAYIEDQIQPTVEPRGYNSNTDAIAALDAEQIDGIVVDLPTAFYITAAEMDDGVVVGQFPHAGEEAEHFSMVLEQGSALTGCVNAALGIIDGSGDLVQITTEWLSENVDAPVLK